MTEKKSLSEFQTLFNANVDHHVYTKPINKNLKLKYMQWAWVWWYLKNYDPNTTLKFKQFKEYDWRSHACTGRTVDFNDTANGCYVTAILTVGGRTQEQSLPVMDNKNQAVIHPDMMQINKAKQRCFVKCAAMFGLGLKIYGMEDTVTYANHRNNYGNHPSHNYGGTRNGNNLTNYCTQKQVGYIKGLIRQTKSDGSSQYRWLTNNYEALNAMPFNYASRAIKFLQGLKKQQANQKKSSNNKDISDYDSNILSGKAPNNPKQTTLLK